MLWLDILLIAIISLFIIGTVVSAYIVIADRLHRRGPKQWAAEWEQQIQKEGYAGFSIKDHGPGDMLTLTWPRVGHEEVWLLLDTRHKRARPDKDHGLNSGISVIDRFFAVRGASPAALANLRANRHRLDGVAAYIEAWWSEHTSIRISANKAEFRFRERRRGSLPPIPARRLVAVLPQMAAFTKAMLAAAWWTPPLARAVGESESHGAYRGGGGQSAVQWELEDPLGEPLKVEPIGPFDTGQILRWLDEGRLSWLNRVRRAGLKKWQPIADFDELLLTVPPLDPGEITQTPRSLKTRTRRWLRTLAHRPSTYLFVMLAGVHLWPALSMGIAELTLGHLSSSWPRTQATITSSELKKTKAKTQSKSQDTVYINQAVIQYTYEVNGQTHTGDRIQFSDDGRGADRAPALVKRYPEGHTVQIYYAPDHPDIATLEVGNPPLTLFGVAVAGILGVLILALAITLSRLRLRIRRTRRWLHSNYSFADR